jgi:hypothetical protein
MTTRLLGVLSLAALLMLGLLGGAALGVDEEEEELPPHLDPEHGLPSIDEIGTQSETAREFFPEEAEEQPFTEALVYPLLGVGLLALLVIGILYLKWQPDFEREGRGSKRR